MRSSFQMSPRPREPLLLPDGLGQNRYPVRQTGQAALLRGANWLRPGLLWFLFCTRTARNFQLLPKQLHAVYEPTAIQPIPTAKR